MRQQNAGHLLIMAKARELAKQSQNKITNLAWTPNTENLKVLNDVLNFDANGNRRELKVTWSDIDDYPGDPDVRQEVDKRLQDVIDAP